MAKTPHHPNPFFDLIEPMVSCFLRDERTRQRNTLCGIIAKNAAEGGYTYGYILQGKVFSFLSKEEVFLRPTRVVSPKFEEEAQHFDLISDKLERDSQRMKSGLIVILTRCASFQDVRDMLPDALAHLFSNMKDLPRVKPEQWVVEAHPNLKNAYEKTINIGLYYRANSLIF